MSLPTIAIQTGLIARYRADTTLQTLIAAASGATAPAWNIFDAGGVPTNTPFPYLVVFPPRSQSGKAMAFGTDAVDSYVQISIFTQAQGLAVARSIAKRIYDTTHHQALNLSGSGFNQFFVQLDSEIELQEPDGITQMIVQKYYLMTQG